MFGIRNKGKLITKSILYAVLLLLVVVFLLPFFWMISMSLKEQSQVMQWPVQWIPNPVAFHNYPDALKYIPFFRYLYNSGWYCLFTIAGALIANTLVAYSFARIEWPGRDILFVVVLSTLILPPQVTMIPLYILFRGFGWLDSYKPLIIPAFFGNAFFIFLLRQFFRTIPMELSDSATIDGASEIRIFYSVVLPLCKPALVIVVLFQFLFAWKDFMGPLIYLNSPEKQPLSLGLTNYFMNPNIPPPWGRLMAAAVLTTLPVIVLFLFGQKTFIKGIILTGLKG